MYLYIGVELYIFKLNIENIMSLFSRNLIIVTIVVNFFIFTLVGPIIEELYFRGYLLARMKMREIWNKRFHKKKNMFY